MSLRGSSRQELAQSLAHKILGEASVILHGHVALRPILLLLRWSQVGVLDLGFLSLLGNAVQDNSLQATALALQHILQTFLFGAQAFVKPGRALLLHIITTFCARHLRFIILLSWASLSSWASHNLQVSQGVQGGLACSLASSAAALSALA